MRVVFPFWRLFIFFPFSSFCLNSRRRCVTRILSFFLLRCSPFGFRAVLTEGGLIGSYFLLWWTRHLIEWEFIFQKSNFREKGEDLQLRVWHFWWWLKIVGSRPFSSSNRLLFSVPRSFGKSLPIDGARLFFDEPGNAQEFLYRHTQFTTW